jgi:hypothetical protein
MSHWLQPSLGIFRQFPGKLLLSSAAGREGAKETWKIGEEDDEQLLKLTRCPFSQIL